MVKIINCLISQQRVLEITKFRVKVEKTDPCQYNVVI